MMKTGNKWSRPFKQMNHQRCVAFSVTSPFAMSSFLWISHLAIPPHFSFSHPRCVYVRPVRETETLAWWDWLSLSTPTCNPPADLRKVTCSLTHLPLLQWHNPTEHISTDRERIHYWDDNVALSPRVDEGSQDEYYGMYAVWNYVKMDDLQYIF